MTAAVPSAGAGTEVGLLQGANQIRPEEWDGLARRGFHLHDWFVAAEKCGWRPRHVVVRGAEGIRGVVPAYLTARDTLYDLHDRWLGPLRDVSAVAGVDLRPIISVQAPFALMSEPLGDPDLLSPEILHRAFEALEDAATADGAKAVAWPCVDAVSAKLLQVGRERGYAALYAGACARIPVEWSSFEDYLASRSKNVRRTINADLNAIGSAGLSVQLESDFRWAVPAMTSLYFEAFRRRNGSEAPVQREFFEQLSRRPSDGIRAQLTWSGTRLVGASLNLMTPDLLEGTLAAFSAEHRGGAAYYNDLCYEPIRLACRERIAAIDLGATALYPKVLRGAVLRRRFILIKGTTPGRHRLLATLGRLVARRTRWKERRALGSLWKPELFRT
jgi:predicted N-acyltransferase